MEIDKCMKCGKVVSGYTEAHVWQLMKQHGFKHEREELKAQALIDELKEDERGLK